MLDRHRYLLLLILLLALFFRAHALTLVPPGIQGDEMFNARDALSVGVGHLPVFFPSNFGREPLYIYLLAVSLRLLGANAWAVRFPSVVAGVVTVMLVYLLAAHYHGKRVGLLAAALTSVSMWPLMLSRVGLRAVLLPPFQMAMVYSLERVLRGRGGLRWAVAAGLFAGLQPYIYIPGQLSPLVLFAWGGVVAMRQSDRRARLAKLGVAVAVAALTVAPFVIYAAGHHDVVYQRVGMLSGYIHRLLDGDWKPVRDSTVAVLRMFTRSGDPSWRYNLFRRPVFDPVTGWLFYLGLLVALVRLRRPGYLLWLMWLPPLLVPSMLTDFAPSFWRVTGALVPIYVLPAIGAEFVWTWAVRLLHGRGEALIPVLLGAGLVGVAADTWHDYFTVWARNREVCHAYVTGLSAAARYLDEHEPDTTPVWISDEFAWDWGRYIFDLQSRYPGPVRWFNGLEGVVWPSPSFGEDVLLIFSEYPPVDPAIRQALSPYLVYQEASRCETPYLWVYRIPADALATPPWEMAHPLEGRFARGFEVLGYTAATAARRGEEAAFTLYWQVPEEHQYSFADPPRTSVSLEDSDGHRWSEAGHFPPYPLQDWTPGDRFAERFEVPVPGDMPPLTVTFHVEQFTSRYEIRFADEEHGGVPLRVGSLAVGGRVTDTARWDAETPLFGGEMALLEADVPYYTTFTGGGFDLSLRWQAVRKPSADYGLRFWWQDAAGNVVPGGDFETTIWGGLYPPTAWAAGEVVRSFHRVPVPLGLAGGEYLLCLTLTGPDGRPLEGEAECLGPVGVTAREHSFARPSPRFPLEAMFGTGIRLLGYDLESTEPLRGGQLTVTLYWEAVEEVAQDYTVFVHLYTPDKAEILAQHDGVPAGGVAPTGTWLPGEVVTDRHLVAVSADAPEVPAPLGIGLYLPDTGERLPVFVDGVRQMDDRLILTEIGIR